MSKNLKRGDKVNWETSQGKTAGKVVRKQTSDTTIKDHQVKASKDDPRSSLKVRSRDSAPRTSPKLSTRPERAVRAGRYLCTGYLSVQRCRHQSVPSWARA